MQPITVSATGIAASVDNLAASQAVEAAGALTLETLAAAIGSPAQIVLETNADYTGISFTVVGTDANGSTISEVLAGPNTATVESVLYFASITSITASGGVVGGTVQVGTTGDVTSRWVRMDSWANAQSVAQVDTSGTITYSVQTSMDDPNDPVAPVAILDMTWLDALDANLVSETAAKSGAFAYTPTWVRVSATGGTGTATLKIAQFSNAPY
jgi:hypothetical protein